MRSKQRLFVHSRALPDAERRKRRSRGSPASGLTRGLLRAAHANGTTEFDGGIEPALRARRGALGPRIRLYARQVRFQIYTWHKPRAYGIRVALEARLLSRPGPRASRHRPHLHAVSPAVAASTSRRFRECVRCQSELITVLRSCCSAPVAMRPQFMPQYLHNHTRGSKEQRRLRAHFWPVRLALFALRQWKRFLTST